MICKDIMQILNNYSPLSLACEWDNVGLQIGDKEKPIKKIFVALDPTEEVIEEAISKHADMLITHHPLLFKGIKKICNEDFIGNRVIKLIKNNICYYAMHTNFDVSHMADLAADMLSLKNIEVLETTIIENGEEKGIGKVGDLKEPITLLQCADKMKHVFDIDTVKVFGERNKKISRVAISPGSGKSMIIHALEKNVDVLITGDIDHHEGLDANARNLCIIDGGHYGTEKLFVNHMCTYLRQELMDVDIVAEELMNPFFYM